MRKIFAVLLLLLFSAFVNSATPVLEQLNCSHMKVTTDSNMYVDIQYYVDGQWQNIYSMVSSGGSGIVIKETLFNGTHRALARQSVLGAPTSSSELLITTCAPTKVCSTKSDCDAGQYCSSGSCAQGDCASNTDCASDKTCSTQSHACVSIPCICGKVENHACTKFQCCFDANCTGGKICVSNACVENTTGSTGGTGGSGNSGQGTGSSSGSQNNGTTGTGSGNTGGSSGASGQAGASGGAGFLSSGLGLACIGGVGLFFVFIIGLFLIVALVAVFYKRK